MAKRVEMPKMGYDMTEGKIARWIKQEGDTVQVGDAIAEIETDKVSIEIEAFDAGVLRTIVRQVGDRVEVGGVIAVIEAEGSTWRRLVSLTPRRPPRRPATVNGPGRPTSDRRASRRPARLDGGRRARCQPVR
jgi:pyruvate/2-oxoglutarate dehydrogenase complex dihydrolipoamide acyltransferase (E2) component